MRIIDAELTQSIIFTKHPILSPSFHSRASDPVMPRRAIGQLHRLVFPGLEVPPMAMSRDPASSTLEL